MRIDDGAPITGLLRRGARLRTSAALLLPPGRCMVAGTTAAPGANLGGRPQTSESNRPQCAQCGVQAAATASQSRQTQAASTGTTVNSAAAQMVRVLANS